MGDTSYHGMKLNPSGEYQLDTPKEDENLETEKVEELQEKVGTALYELGLLHKTINPTPNSYIDRQFETVKELLHEGLSKLERNGGNDMNTEVVKEFMGIVRKHSPKCFVNTQMELIVEPKNNVYFRLEDVEEKAHMQYKVIAWLSRPACKGVSNYWQYRIRNIVNEYLGTDFDQEQMEAVYTRFGNGCNKELCMDFIESKYDLSLLNY